MSLGYNVTDQGNGTLNCEGLLLNIHKEFGLGARLEDPLLVYPGTEVGHDKTVMTDLSLEL